MAEITARMKADAAKREVAYRRRVYERKIEQGTMTHKFADEQIAVMLAIQRDYEKIADEEEAEGRLL